jgi:hypothetical protein
MYIQRSYCTLSNGHFNFSTFVRQHCHPAAGATVGSMKLCKYHTFHLNTALSSFHTCRLASSTDNVAPVHNVSDSHILNRELGFLKKKVIYTGKL